MKKRTIKIAAVLSFAVGMSFGGESLLGVNYPLGVPQTLSGYAARMGGSGIGADVPHMLMTMNPGNLGNLEEAGYSFKLDLEYNYVRNSVDNANFFDASPQYLGFALPLGKLGNLGIGYATDYSNKYTYYSPEKVLDYNEMNGAAIVGRQGFNYQTGLTSWEIGFGREIFPFFKPGLAFKKTYFKREQVSSIEVKHHYGSIDSIGMRQASEGIRFGFTGSAGPLSYGVSGEYNLKGTVYADTSILKLTALDTSGYPHASSYTSPAAYTTGSYTMQLPPKGGVGFSYYLNDKIILSADYSMTLWERMWDNIPNLLSDVSSSPYQNTMKIALGGEYTPASNLLNPKFAEIISYSGGLRYETLPYSGDREGSITLGLGMPLGINGMVDLSLEGGFRKSDTFDYEENFLKFSISSSGGRGKKRLSKRRKEK